MTSHIEEGSRPGPAAGSIETLAALRTVSGVRDAVMTEHCGADGRTLTLGYVTGPDPALGTAWIRQQLLSLLPDYLIPEQFVVLDTIPLTPEGEYDLTALPEPDLASGPADSYVGPRTPEEQQVADVMKELLGVAQVGIYDSFFALGGSSILATRLTSRLREVFGVEVLLRDVFATPTADGLAQLIVHAQQRSGAEQRRHQRRRLRERAFRYVAGHPVLVSAWDQVKRIGPAPPGQG